MAVSASFDFTLTRDNAIQEALELLGALGEGESPTAAQLTSCSRTLNLMLKHWQNREVSQSLIRKFYVFLDDEVREYDLSTTAASSAHSATNFYTDTLASDYTTDDLSITVTTGTGAADGDTILLVADDGSIGAGDVESGGATTTLVTPAIEVEAESGNLYFAYTTKAIRPLDILYANRCFNITPPGEDGVLDYIRQPCDILARKDMIQHSNPDSDGTVNVVWYDSQWPTAKLHVWPEPQAGEFLEVWGQFTIDDMDDATDNFALPSRWYLAVATNLAYWLMGKYGASADTRATIKEHAARSLREAEEGEGEDYLKLEPDTRRF